MYSEPPRVNMAAPTHPDAWYGGDEHFVYFRIDRFIEDVLMFAPPRCNTNMLRTLLVEWFDKWDGTPSESLAWVDELVEACTWQPPERNRHIPSKVRREVLERDGHRCVVCGATDGLAIDHVKPFVRGGSNKPKNLQVLCRPCNSSKHAKAMDVWLRQRGQA